MELVSSLGNVIDTVYFVMCYSFILRPFKYDLNLTVGIVTV